VEEEEEEEKEEEENVWEIEKHRVTFREKGK
jgi:hypothetical protein